jgi:hypothetical protein
VPRSLGLHIAAGLLLAACVSQAWAQGSAVFTCVDSKGRRLTADRPIAECNDREQKMTTPSGTVIRKIGPSLTAEERAAEEDKLRKAADERNRQLEEKKRDRALLTRYPERAVHDKERAGALATADDVTATAHKRLAQLAAERKRLDVEVEFFKGEPAKVPALLKRQIEENALQTESQKRFIAGQDAEKKRINARYDEELVRLKQLWPLQATPSAPATAKR